MSTEAMQQAMEALKESIDVPCYGGHPKQEAAYHALREALANEALDKKAENARELGLHYEPAQRTWVGLTDEETLLIFATCHEGWAYPQDAQFGPRAMRLTEGRAIEAALRSKNENSN